jgi:hypothetical protein
LASRGLQKDGQKGNNSCNIYQPSAALDVHQSLQTNMQVLIDIDIDAAL